MRTDPFFDKPPALPDNTVPYHQSSAMFVPETGGVYIIHDQRGPLYVGRSRRLRERFEAHYWRADNVRLRRAVAHPWGQIHFSWIEADESEQATLEVTLTRTLSPRCNTVQFKRRERS